MGVMQILECSMFGLRAARHQFTHPNSSMSVTLFPMVHIGETAFYENTFNDALSHDVVLTEGVRSPVVRHLTSSYRWINVSKLGLIVQPRLPPPKADGARVIHADLSAEEFHIEWRKVPRLLRLAAFIIAPVMGLHRRLFATRKSLAHKMEMDDLQSSEEALSWDPTIAAFKNSILGARDARLILRLGEELDRSTHNDEPSVAVIYGAAHMRAVLTELLRRGFRPIKGSWQTIFAF